LSKKVIILGAGISGLAAAYLLNKNGYDVIVLEKNKEAGGSMESVAEKGFLFDRGPNSGLETTPLIRQLVDELGLADEMIYSNREGNKRYILRDGNLHPLPMTPQAFIGTKLFSSKAKFRVFAEPFIKRSSDGYYQSIAQFVERRLGKEFLDYAINPFVAGVYAGNPEGLSVHSAFPKLYELEEKYGGLIKGTIKGVRERKKRPEVAKQSAQMFSFKSGMQVLPKTIAKKLGSKVRFFADVKSVVKEDDKYRIKYVNANQDDEILCDAIISAIPSYQAAEIFGGIDEQLVKHLSEVYYPPVLVLYAGYKKEQIGRKLDGFGFLIPAVEKKSFLGAIWSSVIFPQRSTEDHAAFTIFVGGSRSPEIFAVDKQIVIKKVINEFNELMQITEQPDYLTYRFWNKAIPQYNIGYIEHERYFDKFEADNPGIILSGNYRGGISVGDCIKNSEIVYNKAVKFLS